MPEWIWAVVIVAAVLLLAVVAWQITRARSQRLRDRFGGEYDRTIERTGRRREAEAELREREKRREELEIRPLPPLSRERYAEEWRRVQARFVDEPAGAVAEADRLVAQVMRERGYPMDDFEQRAADVSVDHPAVVEDYRAGHAIYLAYDRGDAGTEDLRQAMVHYRALFAELLEDGGRPSEQQSRSLEEVQ